VWILGGLLRRPNLGTLPKGYEEPTQDLNPKKEGEPPFTLLDYFYELNRDFLGDCR